MINNGLEKKTDEIKKINNRLCGFACLWEHKHKEAIGILFVSVSPLRFKLRYKVFNR